MITRECPSSEELSKYTLGTLREESVPGLQKHLDACPVCTETIQLLESQTDSFTGMLKNRQAPPDLNLLNEEPFLSTVANLARMSIADSFIGSALQPHLTVSSTSNPVPQPGQKLGQYTLLEVVGEGGMGLVYRARQEKLNKTVALKLLSAARVHDPRMQVRFHREMWAAGTIDHPNVVRAFDADEVDGVHFLVMEFVDGVDLSAMLKQLGPLSVAHACSMIRMAAVGLSQIHQAGMVHRDVKPGNLMLSKEGQVKILDLGLALLNPSHSPVDDDLSSASQLMGTVDYMSPEQADNTHEVDFRTDIYGLGATLFALLTGRSPLGDRQQTLMQKLSVLANEPAPSPLRYRADIPEELAEFVTAMLNRDPSLRPASAAEVAVALEPYARNQGLQVLIMECGKGKGNIAAGRPETVDDTMLLYADNGSLTVSQDTVIVASATVAPTNQTRKATLAIGFAALLIGTVLIGIPWILSRADRSANVADATSTLDALAITPLPVINAAAASEGLSTAGASTSISSQIAMAELNAIATSRVAGTSETVTELPWHIFSSDAEPDLRTTAIHRAVASIPPETLVRQLLKEERPSVRAGVLLAISEFDQAAVLNAVNTLRDTDTAGSTSLDLVETLLHWYVNDPNPEVHAGVEFLLRRWGHQDRILELRPIVEQKLMPFDGGWYQPLRVSAMVVIPGPRTEQLGSPADEPGRFTSEQQIEDLHTVNIPYTFAIGSTEVTRYQFWRSSENYWQSSPPDDPELPVNDVLWGQAAEFCNRLSLLEGLNEDDLCYFSIESGGSTRWRQKPDAVSLSGYRLPTDDEWEIACRAGTRTSLPIGEDLTWIDRYFVSGIARNSPLPVASLKPNSFGLFDMLGNVSEWIHSDPNHPEDEKGRRRIRGGSAWTPLAAMRSASRFHYPSSETSEKIGFRVARTILRRPIQSKGPEDILHRVELQLGPPASTQQTEAFADSEFTPLLDQQVVRFGTWDARNPPSRIFRLKNTSDQPLQMSQLPWMNGSFEIDAAPALLIPPNGVVDFRIRIPIGRVGEHTHDLRFRWEGIAESDSPVIRLHGCLEGPLLDMFKIGRFGSVSNAVNLGRVPVGSQPGTRLFMRNIGDRQVQAEVNEITGPFALTAPFKGTLVPHQMDQSFRVVLDTSRIGLAEGKIMLKTKQDPPAEFSFTIRAEVSDSKAFSPIGVFRNGIWMIVDNRDTVIDETIAFGTVGDQPLTGDWNGDGVCDIAVWRKTGDGGIVVQFRLRGDPSQSPLLKTEIRLESEKWIPVAADLDGDGTSEIGYVSSQVPGEGMVWTFDTQHNETYSHRFVFGSPGSDPVIGDWNGDGIDEVAVSFHGKSAPIGARLWQIQQTDNAQPKERVYLSSLDIPLAGDWDGDGDDDLGGWRPEPNKQPCFWQFETSGDIDSECDLEGLGVETDIPFVLRHNEKRATAQ